MKRLQLTQKWVGKSIALFAIITLTNQLVFAQQDLKIVRATSRLVDIRDGDYFKKDLWILSPETRPDKYYVIGPRKERKVTFYTDIDSISFDTTPGHFYDFVILLNNKDSCYTRITTRPFPKNSIWKYQKNCTHCENIPDTIPFTIGSDNRIYIKGKVNHSENLNFEFDTGGYGVILSGSGLAKTNVIFDGSTESLGYGGSSHILTSSKGNKLEVGGLTWNNLPVVENAAASSDGVIGYKLFENNIVEINYDKQIMIIHQSAFKPDKDYEQFDMEIRGDLPFIKVTLDDGNKIMTSWMCFDTGNTGSINLDDEFSEKNHLYGAMKKIGDGSARGLGPNTIKNEIVLLPKLLIKGYELSQIPIHLELPTKAENVSFSILGNDVLKRFNAIIDYQNSYIYLQPNSLFNTPFYKTGYNQEDHYADKQAIKLDTALLKKYVGTYRADDQSTILITLEKGKLMGQPARGVKTELMAISQNHFVIKERDIKLEFEKNEGGEIYGLKIFSRGHSAFATKVIPDKNSDNVSRSEMKFNWGLVGSATPNGWNGPDYKLMPDQSRPGIWYLRGIKLSKGAIKFRMNNNWVVNYGDNEADGTLESNGDNIQIEAGIYDITLDLTDANQPKYSITKE